MCIIPPRHATQFFIGQPPPNDAERNDVVVVPHTDTYRGIARKTMALMIYGALNTSARYLLKCDDDSFVSAHGGGGSHRDRSPVVRTN